VLESQLKYRPTGQADIMVTSKPCDPTRKKGATQWFGACKLNRKKISCGDTISVGDRVARLNEIFKDKKGAWMKVEFLMSSEEAGEINPDKSGSPQELFETTEKPQQVSLEECLSKVEVRFLSVHDDLDTVLRKTAKGSFYCRERYNTSTKSFEFIELQEVPAVKSAKKKAADGPPDLDELFAELERENKSKDRATLNAQNQIEKFENENNLTHSFADLDSSNVNCKPGRPGKPTLSSQTASAVNLAWDAADENGSGVKRYKVEEQEVGTSKWIFVTTAKGCETSISVLEHSKAVFAFRIQAENAIGLGPVSELSEEIDFAGGNKSSKRKLTAATANSSSKKKSKPNTDELLHVPLSVKGIGSDTWEKAVVTEVNGVLVDLRFESGTSRFGVRLSPRDYKLLEPEEMVKCKVKILDSKTAEWVEGIIEEYRESTKKHAIKAAAFGKRPRVFILPNEAWSFR